MIRFFFSVLLPMSAVGTAAVLALYATGRILYRTSKTRWDIKVLLAALCLFLIPLTALRIPDFPKSTPAKDLDTANVYMPTPLQPETALNTVPFLPAADRTADIAPDESDNESDTPSVFSSALLRVLPALWLAGMIAVAAGVCVSYLQFCHCLRQESSTVTDARLQSCLLRAKQASGLKRSVSLRETSVLRSPMAVGPLKPSIYVPVGAAEMETLDYALRHECVHLHRGHIAYKLLAQAVCAIHWFNPATWLLCRMVNDACEFDCDRAVSRGMDSDDKMRYCAALLDAAEWGKAPLLVSAFARPAKTLHKRMEVILMQKQNRTKQIISLALCAVLLLGIIGLTACAARDAADSVGMKMADTVSRSESGTDGQPTSPNKGQKIPSSSQPAGPADPAPSAPPAADDTQTDGASGEPVQAVPEAGQEYVWPVPKFRGMLTPFAYPYLIDPVDPSTPYHKGIDIAAPQGSDIVAVYDGTVTEADYHYSFGNYVLLDHGDGTTSLYAHCDDLAVQVGDTVQAGQLIAHVGTTGMSAGYHCHLQIEQGGKLIDPASLFDMEQVLSTAAFVPGMGCSDPYCMDASHHHDCPSTCTDYSHYHTCSLDCADTSHHHNNTVAFVPGMGCSDIYCTDASHHHDCPSTCTDYSHYHTCSLDCADTSHHHNTVVSTPGSHHSEGHHHH